MLTTWWLEPVVADPQLLATMMIHTRLSIGPTTSTDGLDWPLVTPLSLIGTDWNGIHVEGGSMHDHQTQAVFVDSGRTPILAVDFRFERNRFDTGA